MFNSVCIFRRWYRRKTVTWERISKWNRTKTLTVYDAHISTIWRTSFHSFSSVSSTFSPIPTPWSRRGSSESLESAGSRTLLFMRSIPFRSRHEPFVTILFTSFHSTWLCRVLFTSSTFNSFASNKILRIKNKKKKRKISKTLIFMYSRDQRFSSIISTAEIWNLISFARSLLSALLFCRGGNSTFWEII